MKTTKVLFLVLAALSSLILLSSCASVPVDASWNDPTIGEYRTQVLAG